MGYRIHKLIIKVSIILASKFVAQKRNLFPTSVVLREVSVNAESDFQGPELHAIEYVFDPLGVLHAQNGFEIDFLPHGVPYDDTTYCRIQQVQLHETRRKVLTTRGDLMLFLASRRPLSCELMMMM